MNFRPSQTGLFGKLPARGDFVRAGLPEDFVAGWDVWCRVMMAGSREVLGEGWLDLWMEAPVWRFLLPAGVCGAQAVLGVWLPSVDKVGRQFPFMVGALAGSVVDLETGAGWLDVAEGVALSGVVDDAPHEGFGARLDVVVADAPALAPGWWTEGSPHVAARRIDVAGLVPVEMAGAMLRDFVAAELG